MPNNSRPETSNQRSIPQLLSGTAELIENLRATLNSGTSLSTKSLLARAKHYLDSPISDGRYDFRYLYDALEVALHQIIEDRAATLRVLEPGNAIDHLENLIALLPTQRIRTSEQSLFQQFSSPAHSHSLPPTLPSGRKHSPKILLEPSAGTGALACIARAFGSRSTPTIFLPPPRIPSLSEIPGAQRRRRNINDLLPTNSDGYRFDESSLQLNRRKTFPKR